MSTEGLRIELAGESLLLLPQRALFWPRRQMLIVADIHFGKAAAFRAQGIPVPRGTTMENLGLLDALILRHAPRRLLFLGDFLHAKSGRSAALLAALQAWRQRYGALELGLVRGNHDRHAGDPPAVLTMDIVEEPYRVRPFAFAHHPEALDGAYVLAGHLHPVYRLAARGDALRLPCFLLGNRVGVLPAFGAFTGGHPVQPGAGERVYVIAGEQVIGIPVNREMLR